MIQSQDPANSANRELDLSLSFSEDSDELHHHQSHHHYPQATQKGRDLVRPELTEQSHRNTPGSKCFLGSPRGSDDDQSSDPSIRDELNNANQTNRFPTSVPSGRKSPIMGEHPPSRGNVALSSPSSAGLDPSPPTISSEYQQNRAYLHPQAQNLSQDELANWLEAAYQQNTNLFEYAKRNTPTSGSMHSNTDPSEYSADHFEGEFDDSHIQRFAGACVRGLGIQSVDVGTEQFSQRKEGRNPGIRAAEPRNVNKFDSSAVQQVYNEEPSERDAGHNSEFKVYWKRWLMLMYMSVLNLLSDWTCYSVAPIALLTEQAFGSINPELLVTVFLIANAVASACEPIILSRLGLRRTVLFGSLLLMIGSIVKSGGMPPIIEADLQKGQGEWRVYVGFLLVGLSQPLYQCTPALLSASWFPDVERTLATGIALNANQVGIGFAFIFGTLLVVDSDDIPPYFGLLSIISTVTFLGVLIQFEDAPPTPPSDSARVMKGTLEVKLPSVQSMFDSIRNIGADRPERFSKSFNFRSRKKQEKDLNHSLQGKSVVSDSLDGSQRQSCNASEMLSDEKESVSHEGGSPAYHDEAVHPAPSPSNVWPVSSPNNGNESDDDDTQHQTTNNPQVMHPYLMHASHYPYMQPPGRSIPFPVSDPDEILVQAGAWPSFLHHNLQGDEVSYFYPLYPGKPHQLPYAEQSFDNLAYYQTPQPLYGSSFPYQSYNYPLNSYYTGGNQYALPSDALDEGAEPVLILTPHHLDINIRDDQVLLSIKACMARRGFVHSLVAFTVSGVVINTLSTFMDYLVRLNGAGRAYTGIVGGTFQFAIMVSSLIVGKICDTTRTYYSITIFMLVMGAFGLAECGVSLDEAKGTDLRFALVIVALLVGPLQPISTELGVEVVYPLSENTVLVIQQLFSNLLSAMFIPCFKAMKDMGLGKTETRVSEKPEYTFSFYLLIVLHAGATVFFATFNGRYLRHDHELERATIAKRRAPYSGAFRLVDPETQSIASYPSESMPLIAPEH
ncbi:hypothetical protein FisN_4Lh015 [Fistulifera solaris]|uniref:Major facilitator superfamily (MFS) profile domain-containing protein n=1 Tax=Fistulifera solaris TaxID=1519565 RepID=A0A1Z5KDT2_FISSO|nr:hypothetical protein FisN_4Lh015 [Fistulifera solaris]|eukprot:GAX24282.1 hypothetical protein FisN_4Lh015 [Fistulifera solaris]